MCTSLNLPTVNGGPDHLFTSPSIHLHLSTITSISVPQEPIIVLAKGGCPLSTTADIKRSKQKKQGTPPASHPQVFGSGKLGRKGGDTQYTVSMVLVAQRKASELGNRDITPKKLINPVSPHTEAAGYALLL
ncbi:hypothetical protein FA13DRAFT_1737857 [Coprinellus micaceus]|uniref:Uncharacterized protein n=1 Tax=Coprinellus micaceus TaxID=71717 RepID=A0A4Y7SVQ0_COPMI|nr:hypothetical protein FA13DRAFT_1737857 [Coprinellus micaceus]